MADDKKEKKKVKKKKEGEGDAPAEAAPAAAAAAPAAAAPAASSGGSQKQSSAKRAKRTGSSVFSMFSQRQVQEFKEAFQLMDANKDGILDKNDLRSTFDTLGRIANDKDLDEMLKEAPGPITFTIFLSIFGERISGTDDEDVINKAFAVYDEGGGKVAATKLKHDLMTWGEKFNEQEVEDAFEQAPIDGDGKIDVVKFANLLTKGEDEEEGAA